MDHIEDVFVWIATFADGTVSAASLQTVLMRPGN
jgi:hypothetical protein